MKYNKILLFFIVIILTIVSVNATDINNNSTITANNNYIEPHNSLENGFNEEYTSNSKEIQNNTEIDNNYFYDDSIDVIDNITDIDENKSITDYPRKVSNQNNNNKSNITINLKDYTAYAGKTIIINATVKTTNNTPVTSAKVAFKVNGKTQAHLNVTNGTVLYNFKVPQWSAKKYNLTLVVGETSNTNSLSKNSTLTLYRLNTTIKTSYLTFAQRNTMSYINATICDQIIKKYIRVN
ncbi:MAG: hypothetical protein PUA60_03655 [Methanobacteriaceae archaeon]|jgi:hypothetical protein|nr:hypothetical protein [Methanobacteriaceae archaeon]